MVQIGMSAEDVPLLVGLALAVAGTFTHNVDLTGTGLAIIAGKAVLKPSPPEPTTPDGQPAPAKAGGTVGGIFDGT